MSCVVWNTRGLGNQRAFRELRRLVAEKKPTILFLSETRRRNVNTTQWRFLLDFFGCFTVDFEGRRGGLCLLWKDSVNISITSWSSGHIDCTVLDGDKHWRFTGFYGHPDPSCRSQSWALLRCLAGIPELKNLPWLIGGDFNEICFENEKWGGNIRTQSQMQDFRDALSDCYLQDLHCTGELFTWANRRAGDHLILERLDRFVGTIEWRLLYPTASVHALEFFHSDHRPLYIQLGDPKLQEQRLGSKSGFIPRFELGWLREPECAATVYEGWRPFDGTMSLTKKIANCSRTLHQWARHKLRALPRKIKETRSKLNTLNQSHNWAHSTVQINELESELEKLSTQEEEYWRQRSHVTWLQSGDRNPSISICERLPENREIRCEDW